MVTLETRLTKVISIVLHSILQCLSSMFAKFYLTVAIVLRCHKKCSKFLWYFDDNSIAVYSQYKNNVYLFLRHPFSLLKLLIGFRF